MRPHAHRKALVTGVSRYADAQHDLAYARSDAEAVAQVLQSDPGFDSVATLYDVDASRARIFRFFEHRLQKSHEDEEEGRMRCGRAQPPPDASVLVSGQWRRDACFSSKVVAVENQSKTVWERLGL
jgi:hypothetical protein